MKLSSLRAACFALLAALSISAGAMPANTQDEEAPELAPVVGPLTVGSRDGENLGC